MLRKQATTKMLGIAFAGLVTACAGAALMPQSAFAESTVADGVYTIKNSDAGKFMEHGMDQVDKCSVRYVEQKEDTTQFELKYVQSNDAYLIRSVSSMGYITDKGYVTGNTYLTSLPEAYWKVIQDSDGSVTIKNCKTGSYLSVDYSRVAESEPGTLSYYVYGSTNQLEQKSKWELTKLSDTIAQPIEDGEYIISTTGANNLRKVFDITNGSKKDGARLQTYPYTATDAQVFRLEYNPADYTYSVINVKSGKALDIANGVYRRGIAVQQYSPNHTNAQKWYIVHDSRGYNLRTIRGNSLTESGSVALNKFGRHDVVLTTDGESYDALAGTFVSFVKADEVPDVSIEALDTENVLVQLTPTLNSTDYRVNGKIFNDVLAIDVRNASSKDRTNIQLYKYNGTLAQCFYITKLDNDNYQIMNVLTNKLLDVADGSKKSGANVWQFSVNGTLAQQWKIQANADGSYTFISALSGNALDVTNGKMAPNTNIQVWKPNNTVAQTWWIQ